MYPDTAHKQPSLRIALINAPLRSIVCDSTTGHQIPLGLLRIGGPLIDAGFGVHLVDGACDHLSDDQIVDLVAKDDVVMISHAGTTQAHPCVMRLLAAIKRANPRVITVYGGAYPTFHGKTILRDHAEVDIIARGEGEATALDLALALDRQRGHRLDLTAVRSIIWRNSQRIVQNGARPLYRI